MSLTIRKDVLILGGGIAGLWLLKRLCGAGYDAALLDSGKLGGGQTIASQGMIHGGIKYALSGVLTTASDAIADMPSHWKACLDGSGDIDLRGARVLSQTYFLWPRHSFRSRFNAFFGSKTLRGRVRSLPAEEFPEFCRGRIPGPLYQLTDLVLDIPSLLKTLCDGLEGRIHRVDWGRAALEPARDGIACLRLDGPAGEVRVEAGRYVVTAGAGCASLLEQFGIEAPPMQRRPLHMVMARHEIQAPVYVHCVADHLSATPELTITTHELARGGKVWYMGGELAESGVGLSSEEQIGRARERLAELFPWYDFSTARWASFHIDRAEPRQPLGKRPDKAFVHVRGNLLVGWPTKLSLAPNLAAEVLTAFADSAFEPARQAAPPLPGFLSVPAIAKTPWEEAFQ